MINNYTDYALSNSVISDNSNDIQGRLPTARLFRRDFRTPVQQTAVGKVSTKESVARSLCNTELLVACCRHHDVIRQQAIIIRMLPRFD